MADGMDKQMEQLRSQMNEMRKRMDQLSGGMEEYRVKGSQALSKMGEQKGIAIPFGLLLTMGLMAMAVWVFFPNLGERMKSMMPKGTTETEMD